MSTTAPHRLQWLRNFEETIGSALLVLIFLCIALQVLTRLLVQSPPFWTEEAARYLFVWLVCIGSAEVVRTRGHITMDILTMMIRPRTRIVLSAVLSVVVCGCLVVLVWYGTLGAMRAHRVQSIALGVPESWIFGALPVGAAMMSVRLAIAIITDLLSLGAREPADATGDAS